MFAPIRLARRLTLAIVFLFPSVTVVAQRLPPVARPQHYTLQLAPDLQAATFTGEETIDLTLAQAVDSIVLNAWQLKFGAVTAQVERQDLARGSHPRPWPPARLRFISISSCPPGPSP